MKIASIYSSIHIYIATVDLVVVDMGEMAMVRTEGEIQPETLGTVELVRFLSP